ncbi:MAG: NAD-dependent epimerase/dehydratase family protein [Chroococcus sp. CMT-3BRIN-NPC107]|jgi:nucleoside-diphosphate-sugar epimerase|nr:NAD-dependent epimerase/dehydratase family protein [Chroococcus sp. CMT-3BRIN-NPC107]
MECSSVSLADRIVLVTGASGFIGEHLCARLHNIGAEVHGISRSEQPSTNVLRWWQGNGASLEDMRRILTTVKPDVIFHLASYVSGDRSLKAVLPTLYSNLISTVNLLTLVAEMGCRRVVVAGSLEEPELGELPIACSPYAAAKWSASVYTRMFYQLYQVPVVGAQLFMVYGPAQKDLNKLIPYVTLSLLRGETPKLSSGKRQVDWIYVGDIVDGLMAAAQKVGIEGENFELGSSKLTPVSTVVYHLNQLIDPNIRPLFGALNDRPMEQVRTANIASAIARLGWHPQTSLEEGLAKTVNWYASQLGK